MKLAGDSTDGVDFISSLPDAVLQHILANVPTKFAIRTSVLSKQWKHVWSNTPSLSIVCHRVDPNSMNKTITSYTAPKITSFDVTMSYDVTAPEIDTWINLAVSRNAENLSLKFRYDYRFPDIFFTNSSVKQLSLDLGYSYLIPKCIVSWSSLRSLSLNCCKMSDGSIARILSGCSLLESLTFSRCDSLYYLDLSKSLSLRRLEINGTRWFEGPTNIVAPHIHYLRLAHYQQPATLVDVSSVYEAHLNLSHVLDYFTSDIIQVEMLQYMVRHILVKLRNVQKLTIGAILLQILSLAELCGVPFPEFNIRALTVETTIDQSVIPGIARLLQNSPRIKRITANTMKCNTIPDKHLGRYLKLRGLDPDQCWRSKYGVFPTVEQTSSTSMLDGGISKDAKSKHVASFIKFVMGNTKTLEMMVLQSGDYLDAAGFEELPQTVPTFSDNNVEIVIKQ